MFLCQELLITLENVVSNIRVIFWNYIPYPLLFWLLFHSLFFQHYFPSIIRGSLRKVNRNIFGKNSYMCFERTIEVRKGLLTVWIYTVLHLLKAQNKTHYLQQQFIFPTTPQHKCSLFKKNAFCAEAIESLTQLVANSTIHPQGTYVIHRSISSCLWHFISGQVWKKFYILFLGAIGDRKKSHKYFSAYFWSCCQNQWRKEQCSDSGK